MTTSRENAGQDDQHDQDGADDRDGQGDPWDDLVLDESFVREAEVEEPAARTRMLRERWKREAPAPQPWRSDTPPAGWIHGSGSSGRPRRRRWFRRKGPDGAGE